MKRFGIYRDEMYPVYYIVDLDCVITEHTADIPLDLVKRIRLAEKEFGSCQEELEKIYNKART